MSGTGNRRDLRAIRRPKHAEVRRQRRGFSVIELIVVMIMMGIIAGMAVPRLNYDRYRADGAMRVVRTVLQGAQRNAIMRQTDVVVAIDETTNQLKILEDVNNNCMKDAGERLSVRPLEDGAKFHKPPVPWTGTSPSTAILGTNLCVLNGLPAVQFLRDGAASSDVDVYVTSARGRTIDYRMIRVTMASGRSESFRYNGSAWVRFN